MEGRIELSIIIPVYNVEKHLESCVDSLLDGYMGGRIEVLLVNDGSTDNSSDVCRVLQDKYDVVSVLYKQNGGASSARNAGLEKVRGEYITFIDSDDYVGEGYIESILDDIKNRSEIMVYSYQIDYLENSSNKHMAVNLIDELENVDCKDAIRILMDKGAFNIVWNKVYKREIIELEPKIRFPLDYEPGEDLVFNCTYFKRIQKCLLSPMIFYHWVRRGEDTLANRFRKDLFIKNQKFIEERNSLYKTMNLDTDSDQKQLYTGNISYIFVCVPNMYRGGNKTFHKKDRLDFYREIMHQESIMLWVNTITPPNKLIKLFVKLYRLHSPVLMDLIFYWLMFVRRNFGGVWNTVRSNLLHEKDNHKRR